MSVEGTFVLLMPVAAIVYFLTPLFPLIALARRQEILLGLCTSALCYGLPLVVVLTIFSSLNLSGSITEVAYLLLFGPAVAATLAVVLVLLAYVWLWRAQLIQRRRLF